MSTSNGHLPQWGPVKPEGDVPGSVSFTGTLHSGVRGKPKQLSQGCEGPVKPEGDVPGSVSFTGTLHSGVGATHGVRAPGRGLSLPGRIQDIKNRRADAFRLIIYSRILLVKQYRPRGFGGANSSPGINPGFAGYAIPANPMKASARMPTVIRAIGIPLKALGTSFRARCSRRPAKRTIARP